MRNVGVVALILPLAIKSRVSTADPALLPIGTERLKEVGLLAARAHKRSCQSCCGAGRQHAPTDTSPLGQAHSRHDLAVGLRREHTRRLVGHFVRTNTGKHQDACHEQRGSNQSARHAQTRFFSSLRILDDVSRSNSSIGGSARIERPLLCCDAAFVVTRDLTRDRHGFIHALGTTRGSQQPVSPPDTDGDAIAEIGCRRCCGGARNGGCRGRKE